MYATSKLSFGTTLKLYALDLLMGEVHNTHIHTT